MFWFQLVNSPESFIPDLSRIQLICEKISEQIPLPQKGILNIAFLPDAEIQSLNKQYRGIDTTTDVLSFHYFDDFSEVHEDDIAGEIILSESRIRSQSEEHNHSFEKEFEILVIHSILHIIGFDHEDDDDFEEMWKYEWELRKSIIIQ